MYMQLKTLSSIALEWVFFSALFPKESSPNLASHVKRIKRLN